MKMLKIGIVGLGTISGAHLAAIEKNPDAELAAACDIDSSKRSVVGPDIAFYTDLKTMLENEKIDCLHVCLPHYLNTTACIIAAEKNINVFMEKPVGIGRRDIKQLCGKLGSIKAGVCFQNRYNETTIALKEIISKETYGKVIGIKGIVTWSRDKKYYSTSWRGNLEQAGSGVMMNQAIHTIDLMQYFAGPVAWVKGIMGNLLHEELTVEDTACAHFSFESGASGVFYSTVTHIHNSPVEIEVSFERAVLKIIKDKLMLIDEEEHLLAQNSNDLGGKDYWGNKHSYAIKQFHNLLADKPGSSISVCEAAQSVYIIEAIANSARSGKKIYLH